MILAQLFLGKSPTMAASEADERIMQSRVALGAYERSGFPDTSVAEAIGKIAQEIQSLERLASNYPDHVDKISGLVRRYQALKTGLQLRRN